MRISPLVFLLIPGVLSGQTAAAKSVTRAEAAVVTIRMDEILKTLVKNPGPAKLASVQQGDKAATRSEILERFYVLFERAKPGFQIQPGMQSVDPKKFLGLTAGAKTQAEVLAKWGFIAPVGVLVADTKQDISINQFGDAVGFFLARLAELTHKPSSKFSPHLMTNPTSDSPKPKKRG